VEYCHHTTNYALRWINASVNGWFFSAVFNEVSLWPAEWEAIDNWKWEMGNKVFSES
jgi:hypothetical protein